MRKKFKLKTLNLLIAPVLAFSMPIVSHAQKTPARQGQFADGIAVVVNEDIITVKQLEQRLAMNRVSYGDAGAREQVLQDMLDELLIEDEAKRLGVEISNAQLQDTVTRIAQRNNMSPEQLRDAAKQHGIKWEDYLEDIRQQLTMDALQEDIVRSRVHLTQEDIEAYLKQNPTGVPPDYKPEVVQADAPPPEERIVVEQSFEPKAIALQHLYVRVPDDASDEATESARQKANAALRKLQQGSSFEAVAQEYSDSSEVDLGLRLFEDWPELFVRATQKVPDGRTTGVFKAPNGFHILKVVERRGIVHEQERKVTVQPPRPKPQTVVDPRVTAAKQEGPVEIQESHVRHILIKKSPVMSSEKAQQKIVDIQDKISQGLSFSDAAVKYSEDTSAPIGGDIGWIEPGQADSNFEKAVEQLEVGQVSQPVESSFGWHLIEVLDRRTEDKKDSIRKELAQEALYSQRSQAVLEDWMNQLRGRAFIENRLEK